MTGWCLASAGGLLVASMILGPRRTGLWLGLCVCGCAAGLLAAGIVLFGAADWQWRSAWNLAGESVHLRLDGLSALFFALLAVVGGTGAVYACGYLKDTDHPVSAPRNRGWWSALVTSMGLVLLVSNGLHFLMAWEWFALSGYFLIVLERKRREVRAAGWLYLAASHAGTLMLFAFFSALAYRTGSWDLGPWHGRADLAPLFWLALAGFGVKAGMLPLHIWLPSAHANAPSHVSAILSAVAIKMGVYGILRFGGWLPVAPGAAATVAGIGVASALVGALLALMQTDLKRLLAYCSVENVGIILAGAGAAMLAVSRGDAAWGRLALAGSLLHVWNHGLAKSLLFFAAGSVLHATGTREMSRLGGLWRVMPWTAGLFSIAAITLCGLPPLSGFVSEWLIYLGWLEPALHARSGSAAALPAIIGLAVAGALALAALLKALAIVFLGAARTKVAGHVHECGKAMKAPMLALAVLGMVAGVAPLVLWPAIARAVAAWHPGWAAEGAPAMLAPLMKCHLALLLVVALVSTLLLRRSRSNGVRREPTWDCGYAAPTARMQYTAGSFGGIAAGWCAWLLRPRLIWRRPRGVLPAASLRVESMPDPVLERVLAPTARLVLRVSTAVRRLQQGRLQAYVVYLLAGLLGLGLLVLF